MKKIISLLVFCCILTLLGGSLSVNAGTRQKSSVNRKGKKTNNISNPPVRTPQELEYFQKAIEQARRNPSGTVRVIVGVRDFAAQDQLLRELNPFSLALVTRYEYAPYLTLDVNEAALLYMRDSPLVLNVRVNGLLYISNPPVRTPQQLAVYQKLIEQAQRNPSGTVRAIVGVQVDFTPEGYLTPEQRAAQRNAIAIAQENLLTQLAPYQAQLITRYQFVPHLALEVNAAALIYMRDSPLVATIEENRLVYITVPPVRTTQQSALFQNLIERAQARNGTVSVIVGTSGFGAREQLIEQLARFQVQITTRFQFMPFAAMRVNAAALAFMRDSYLVTSIEDGEIRLYPSDPPVRTTQQSALFQKLTQQATADGSTRVIVELNINFTPEGYLTPEQRASQRIAIALTQENLFNRLTQFQVRLIARYQFIPHLALEVNAAALEFLRNSSLVKTIEENRLLKPSLEQSVPLIGAPNAWTRGFSGAGQTIAVLDTGVDKYHIFLRNKVVSEGCYSTDDSSQGLSSLCPGGVSESTAPNSGLNCDVSIGGCDHGTHVAGIAAGNYPEANRYGVAKDAQLISVQVFSKVTDANTVAATTIDINKGLQHVQIRNNDYRIAAVNLSLGDGVEHPSYCDDISASIRNSISTLRSYDIATVIASGNQRYTNGVNFPACISTAISVGSTQDGSGGTVIDTVSDFSNSAPFLSLLAPGEVITSSVPGGGFAELRGTSMAAPHVAGAFAILKQPVPKASVARVLSILTTTGRPVQDPLNGIIKPRIQIDAALLKLVPPVFDYDGDKKSDISVFRPSNGTWYLQRSQAGFSSVQFGQADDRIAPADYDGDGITDIAVFRPLGGNWYISGSSSGFSSAQFGLETDIIAPGDYDGDGRADLAVFRPSNGAWYIQQTSGGFRAEQFGQNGDQPVVGDYDGDGRSDLAVFRPSNGTWYIRESLSGTVTTTQLGSVGDRTVQADYDADGKTDVAVYNNGTWSINRSQDGFTIVYFGLATDSPVPADYDGDRRADVAVFRPSEGNWYLQRSALGFASIQFGQNGDKPTPNAYVR